MIVSKIHAIFGCDEVCTINSIVRKQNITDILCIVLEISKEK